MDSPGTGVNDGFSYLRGGGGGGGWERNTGPLREEKELLTTDSSL